MKVGAGKPASELLLSEIDETVGERADIWERVLVGSNSLGGLASRKSISYFISWLYGSWYPGPAVALFVPVDCDFLLDDDLEKALEKMPPFFSSFGAGAVTVEEGPRYPTPPAALSGAFPVDFRLLNSILPSTTCSLLSLSRGEVHG